MHYVIQGSYTYGWQVGMIVGKPDRLDYTVKSTATPTLLWNALDNTNS